MKAFRPGVAILAGLFFNFIGEGTFFPYPRQIINDRLAPPQPVDRLGKSVMMMAITPSPEGL
jgi:hypothetical protein